MVVSMIQVILELPDVTSIKEKRRIVKSLREKLISRYRITAAEVDLPALPRPGRLLAALPLPLFVFLRERNKPMVLSHPTRDRLRFIGHRPG
mgnify:CR=1 FL=1